MQNDSSRQTQMVDPKAVRTGNTGAAKAVTGASPKKGDLFPNVQTIGVAPIVLEGGAI